MRKPIDGKNMFHFHCNKLFSLSHFCEDNLFWFKTNADVYFFDKKQSTNSANDQKRCVKKKKNCKRLSFEIRFSPEMEDHELINTA